MKRRNLIKSGIYITGYTFLIGGSLSTITSCRQEPKYPDGWSPKFLTDDEVSLVAEVAEAIIPKTDTPGARDALVHQFIDENIRLNFTSDQQALFREGLQHFESSAKATYNKSFEKLSPEEKFELLLEMDKEAKDAEDNKGTHIFTMMKDMTKFGYFTSEVGSKEFLIFDQIPGVYEGCIDYSQVGGTWAI